MNDKDYLKLYVRESLMMNVTEDILVTMEDKNISKAGLATLLDKSKAFVTQMLGGSRNMTLRTLSDIAFALDMEVTVTFTRKKKELVDCSDIQRELPKPGAFPSRRVVNNTLHTIADSPD